MKKATKFAAIMVMLLFAGTAFAGNNGVNKRQHKQQKRISQGVKSGELTKREAFRLEKEQARIAKKERRFKSDGEFTKKEKAILKHDQNKASKHIYKQKHDRQDRN